MDDSNLANYFKALFERASSLTDAHQFAEADQICFSLLREPRLPVLYRAGCNHLLDLGNSNPDQFAEEAVKYYQILHDDAEKGTDEGEKAHTLALLEQAKASLEDARRRVKPPQACEPCGLEGDDGEEGAEAEVDGSHDTNDAEPMAEAEVEAQEQDIGTTDIVSQPSSSDLESKK